MTDEELEARMRRLLVDILAPLLGTQPEPTEQWVPLRQAFKPLGYPSYDALYAACEAGLFRMNKETRNRANPGAKIRRLQINLVAAKKRLSEDAANRRSV
jgi:hypothetical protein